MKKNSINRKQALKNKRWRKPKGQSGIDNPEKLATLGTQDETNKTKHNTEN